MNDMQKGVLILIKSALEKEKLPLPDGFSIDTAYNFIIKHKIMMLAYDGAVRCGIPKENPTMQKLFQNYIQGMLRSEKQMRAAEAIYCVFDENGIDYLPLKGCNMKYLYPKPELRLMGDADILIKEEQGKAAGNLLETIGYRRSDDIDHHETWNSSELHLELHRRLFPKENKKYYSYYGNGWGRALKAEGNRFCFSQEDEFIYLLTHFASHCRNGGAGIRHTADFYIYRKLFPDLDEEYIEKEMEKLDLLKFYKNVCDLMDYWFGDKEKTEVLEIFSDFIFSSGDWGTYRNVLLSSKIKEKQEKGKKDFSKADLLIKAIFPPFGTMRKRYPVLQKYPVLLPFFWVKKWLGIFSHREEIPGKLKVIERTGNKEILEYEEKLCQIGIDCKER